jgi:hypothetical protein
VETKEKIRTASETLLSGPVRDIAKHVIVKATAIW